jgi:hypothetical protein
MLPSHGQDFAVAEVGHFASEVVFMPKWAEQLEGFCQETGLAIQARAATAERAPFVFL